MFFFIKKMDGWMDLFKSHATVPLKTKKNVGVSSLVSYISVGRAAW